MHPLHVDYLVLGSSFAGSLAALALHRSGKSVAVVDSRRHPRFTIGESSTPTGNFFLRQIATQYRLPELLPLTKYGPWKAAFPHLGVGLKRGFSYFSHSPNEPFQQTSDHRTELLVTASPDNHRSDTHWFRLDVDAFLAQLVTQSGIPLFEETNLDPPQMGDVWRISGNSPQAPIEIAAGFIIDASGFQALSPRWFNIPDLRNTLKTNSHSIYAHFENIPRWQELLLSSGASVSDHPFPCDDAALHHVFDLGWMWQLRFDNDVLSAGFATNENSESFLPQSPPERWQFLLNRFPSIASQFSTARLSSWTPQLITTGRLQRLWQQPTLPRLSMLPNTVGFIDPLYSTGIAHTLGGLDRLLGALLNSPADELPHRLAEHHAMQHAEFLQIDRLVSASYQAMPDFGLFTTVSMLYFAAATTFERRFVEFLKQGSNNATPAFLSADDTDFVSAVNDLTTEVDRLTQSEYLSRPDVATFTETTSNRLAPWNHVGLLDPAAENMYRYTSPDDID